MQHQSKRLPDALTKHQATFPTEAQRQAFTEDITRYHGVLAFPNTSPEHDPYIASVMRTTEWKP